jgi:organic radical activating enzyme
MKIEAIFYLTKFCNLECTYCFKGDQKNNKVMSKKKLDSMLKEFSKAKIDTFYLRVRGGEFSLKEETLELFKSLIDFLLILGKHGTKIFIEYSTNLGGTIEYFKKLTTMLYNSGINVSTDFSIHYEYFKEDNTKLINKINNILNIYPEANYRIVFDNFYINEEGNNDKESGYQKEYLKSCFKKLNESCLFKFSNTYGLYLDDYYNDDRINYDTRILIDENILPTINGKRISFRRYNELKNDKKE